MKPILFNTEMVRAILNGRKTVTRRVVKPQHDEDMEGNLHEFSAVENGNKFVWADQPNIKTLINVPYYPGDILYVRETWAYGYVDTTDFECRCNECFFEELKAGTQKDSFLMPRYFYRTEDLDGLNVRWHPSIHMPKEAARLFLRVTGVRVERLKQISAFDAMDEGFSDWKDFVRVWDGTIKKSDLPLYGWNANPWVWVIEFERCEKPEEE